MRLHDGLDEGSQQWHKTLLALNRFREIVQRPDIQHLIKIDVYCTLQVIQLHNVDEFGGGQYIHPNRLLHVLWTASGDEQVGFSFVEHKKPANTLYGYFY